jgi:hypothetical protein
MSEMRYTSLKHTAFPSEFLVLKSLAVFFFLVDRNLLLTELVNSGDVLSSHVFEYTHHKKYHFQWKLYILMRYIGALKNNCFLNLFFLHTKWNPLVSFYGLDNSESWCAYLKRPWYVMKISNSADIWTVYFQSKHCKVWESGILQISKVLCFVDIKISILKQKNLYTDLTWDLIKYNKM